jgi:acetyl esterase/lipase
MRNLLGLAVVALIATSCGAASVASPSASRGAPSPTAVTLGPFPSEEVAGLRTDPDIAYTAVTDCGGLPCTVPGDVLAPADAQGVPTIVLLGGGSTPFAERRYQAPLAVALAKRGAVVFLMSYRSAVTGNYDSQTEEDLRCAVRYARANTAEYGGDPDRVIVVGHSQSGHAALEVATEPEADVDACLADGSGKAEAVIGLGAPAPRSTEASGSAPPMWLFAGSEDLDTATIAEQMRDQGYDAQGVVLPGVTHEGITDPAQAPEIVDLIFEAVDSL